MCKDDAERGISLSSTTRTPGSAVLVGLPRPRGRPGFNEDRRICPIKTSYKDLSGSALIRKTSNLDFAAAAQPLLIPALYRCLPTVIPLSLSLSDSAFRAKHGGGRRGIYGTCFECCRNPRVQIPLRHRAKRNS